MAEPAATAAAGSETMVDAVGSHNGTYEGSSYQGVNFIAQVPLGLKDGSLGRDFWWNGNTQKGFAYATGLNMGSGTKTRNGRLKRSFAIVITPRPPRIPCGLCRRSGKTPTTNTALALRSTATTSNRIIKFNFSMRLRRAARTRSEFSPGLWHFVSPEAA